MTALAVLGLRLRGAWLALAAALLFGLLFAGGARADAPPRITVHPSADTVEVGEAFTIEMKALVDQGAPFPSDPQLKAPPGFSMEGPSVSSQTFINGLGSRAQVLVGIGATWRLAARAPGKYTIAAPTVRWNGKRIAGKSVQIEVVPAGSRPRRPQFANPFLLPGIPGMPGMPGFPSDPTDDDDDAPPPPSGAGKELAMPSAPDPVVFVRAVPDKKSAVIGEQVTVSFYIYFSRRHLQYSTPQGTTAVDFRKVMLSEDPKAEPIVTTTVGGKRFDAALIERWALFPLRAGDLHIGKIKATIHDQRRRVPIGDRSSEDVVIRVTEPPRAGRPVGYALGDVGQFSLEATVQPRKIDQGGSVAVTLKVTGKGNLPQALRLPERTGIEWLDPERKENILPQRGIVEGWRSFGHVVRISESGQVNLGEVALPYWDPAAKHYQVARAPLGVVEVTPAAPAADKDAGAAPVNAPEAKADPFIGMPGARAALSAYTTPRAHLAEGGSLWILIAAPPLLVGAVSAGSGAVRRARARRHQAADAPGALAQKALREADEAAARGDAKALAAALDRAVHLAIEATCGLKSRGVLLADLPEEVARRGLPHALGAAARSLLEECEAIRFEPTAEGARGRDLTARGKKLLADLERREVT